MFSVCTVEDRLLGALIPQRRWENLSKDFIFTNDIQWCHLVFETSRLGVDQCLSTLLSVSELTYRIKKKLLDALKFNEKKQ